MRALGRLGVALLLAAMLAISLWWFLPRDQSADPGTVDPGAQPVAEQSAEDDPAPAADPGTGDAVATAHTETGTVDDAATPAPTGPGVITGHVEDTAGERVAGARIRFELIHWSTYDWPPADPLTRSVTSDSSGSTAGPGRMSIVQSVSEADTIGVLCTSGSTTAAETSGSDVWEPTCCSGRVSGASGLAREPRPSRWSGRATSAG